MSEIIKNYDFSDLLQQPSETPLACSAYTLVNGLRISGVVIPNEAARSLISEVEATLTPLSFELKQLFAQEYGFQLERIPFEEEWFSNFNDMIDTFVFNLGSGLIIFNISAQLSKRDISVDVKTTINENPELEDKEVIHSVLAVGDESLVWIVDPYEPNQPEVFDLNSLEERLELASWLSSVHFQKYPPKYHRHHTKDSILSEARMRLTDPDLFLHIIPFCWLGAKFLRLKKM